MVDICLNDTGVGQILGHCIGDLDGFTEISSERDSGAGKSSPFGEAPGSTADVERFLYFQIFFFQKRCEEVEEVTFFVVIFFVDIFPFVGETFGSLFLMFGERVKIWDGINRSLPFGGDGFGEFFFPVFEKILMSLEEVYFELIYEDTRDTADNRIPRVVCRDDAGNDMGIYFLEYSEFKGGKSKRI